MRGSVRATMARRDAARIERCYEMIRGVWGNHGEEGHLGYAWEEIEGSGGVRGTMARMGTLARPGRRFVDQG